MSSSSINNQNILKAIISGAILGLLLTKAGGALFIGLLFVVAIVVLQRYFKDARERNYVITIFILGFLIRALFLVGAHLYNEVSGNLYRSMGYAGNCIFGDSAYISVKSQALADLWQRRPTNGILFFMHVGSGSLHYYAYSLFYYLFGRHELTMKFINIFYGTTAAVFVYVTAKELFNKKVAGIAYFIAMFLPSLILWSITNLKEAPQILMLCMWLYALIMLRKTSFIRKKKEFLLYTLLLAVALFFTFQIRPRIAFLLFVGAALGFFGSLNITPKKILIMTALFIGAGFLIYCYANNIDIVLILREKSASFIENIIRLQRRTYQGEGYNYMVYPGKFYAYGINPHKSTFVFGIGEMSYFAIKASVLFLTMPLPWTIVSLKQAIVFPQLCLWYFILVFAFIGFVGTLKRDDKRPFFMAGLTVAVVIPMALLSANAGAVFRHRDMVAPFIIIYASYGIWRLLERVK